MVEFMKQATTITSDVYCETLKKKLFSPTENKRREVLLHDNVHPHTAAYTQALPKHFNWELSDHLPYSPDLASSDCYLFTYLKSLL
jgi:hypothetical protein